MKILNSCAIRGLYVDFYVGLRRSWRWRCWMWRSWAGVGTRGLWLWGWLDLLPNSLKRLCRQLMIEKLTFNSRATALVDIPAVHMSITRSLKICDICGIVLCGKTAHFRVAFYCGQPKGLSILLFFYVYVSLCAQSYAQPCKVYLTWLVCVHRRSTHALCAKLQYLSWPSGAFREQLWRLQRDKGHGKYSGKASRDQILLQATVWEVGQCHMFMQFFFGYLVNQYPPPPTSPPPGSIFTLWIN